MENNIFEFGKNSIINKAAGILNCYKEGDALVKAYSDSIIKAEGARGGKVIGHTKSGKPIYDSAGHEAHKNFSIAEHDDAIEAHQKVRDDYHKNNQSTDKDKEDNDKAFEQQKGHIGAKNHMMKDMTPAEARAAAKKSEEENKPNDESGDKKHHGKMSDHYNRQSLSASTPEDKKRLSDLADKHEKLSKSEGEETSDLQKAYETLGLGDLIQKGGSGSGRHPSSGYSLKAGDTLTHKKTGKQHSIKSVGEEGDVTTSEDNKISYFEVHNDYKHKPLKKD
jgi:hypothetical protein